MTRLRSQKREGTKGWVLLLFLAFSLSEARVAWLPFINATSYKGNWKLENDVPAYLAHALKVPYEPVPPDSLFSFVRSKPFKPVLNLEEKRQIASRFNANFVVSGEITRFLVRKRVLGEGKFAGIKSYTGEITLKVKIYSASTHSIVIEDEVSADQSDHNTAVNLGRLSNDEARFDSLNTEPFGSKTFDRTVAGFLMREITNRVRELFERIPNAAAAATAPVTKKLIRTAKVVQVLGADVYINAGTDDGLAAGERLGVFTDGDTLRDPDNGQFLGVSEKKVAEIEVLEIKAARFSRARLVDSTAAIRPMDRVRIER